MNEVGWSSTSSNVLSLPAYMIGLPLTPPTIPYNIVSITSGTTLGV